MLTYSDHKLAFTNPKLNNEVNIEPMITSSDPAVTYSDLH